MTFVEHAPFANRVNDLLDDASLIALQIELIQRPEVGAIIVNGGGLRKVRWAGSGRGKRGGVRIVYYYQTTEGQILLLDIYPKNEKENLTKAELANLKKLIGK